MAEQLDPQLDLFSDGQQQEAVEAAYKVVDDAAPTIPTDTSKPPSEAAVDQGHVPPTTERLNDIRRRAGIARIQEMKDSFDHKQGWSLDQRPDNPGASKQ